MSNELNSERSGEWKCGECDRERWALRVVDVQRETERQRERQKEMETGGG